jgi:hypothetical protein
MQPAPRLKLLRLKRNRNDMNQLTVRCAPPQTVRLDRAEIFDKDIEGVRQWLNCNISLMS